MGRTLRAIAGGALLFGLVVLAPATPGGADGNEGPEAPAGFREITAGFVHSCAILENGDVKCWGTSSFGQLGLGFIVTWGAVPGDMGDNLPAVDLGTGRTATAISAGDFHTCALLDDGTVKCWGFNAAGQLGQGNFTTYSGSGPNQMGDNLPAIQLGTGRTATAIAAGGNQSCALLDDGTVKCWGGAYGYGDTDSRGDQPNEMGDNLPAIALGTDRTATAITAGRGHICALLDNDTVKCWGDNTEGQLGLGNTSARGDQPNEMGDNLPAVDLGLDRTANAVSASAAHTCALLDDGTIKCWGRNATGQLGLGDTTARGDGGGEMGDALPAVDLGLDRTAAGVTTGGNELHGGYTCALLDDDTVKCWGAGGSGRLGYGDTANRGDGANELGDDLPAVALGTGRTATGVTAGMYHTCARLDDGSLKCWGENEDAQLGLEDTADRGDQANEMGDDLPAVRLTGGPPPAVCDGMPVTVDLNLAQTPTAGADVILGTPAGETINGLGGADRICGGGGADTINGGPGADRVFGQAGNDTLNGGAANDRLDGGTQNDTLNGSDGLDTLLGGAGNDTANGGNQNDTANGGGGNDRLNGQNGNDTLNGQAGADTLDGGIGNDRLVGGTQRDTCHGRAGTDTHAGCEVRTGIP